MTGLTLAPEDFDSLAKLQLPHRLLLWSGSNWGCRMSVNKRWEVVQQTSLCKVLFGLSTSQQLGPSDVVCSYMCTHIITVVTGQGSLCIPSSTLKITSTHSLKSRNGDGAPQACVFCTLCIARALWQKVTAEQQTTKHILVEMAT